VLVDFRGAIVAVAVSNATVSNQTQTDFDTMQTAITRSVHELKPALDQTNTDALVLLAIAALLSGVVCLFIVRRIVSTITKPLDRITKPLDRITEALELVSAGDLGARANVRPGDEFREVAKMLNSAIAAEELSLN
jgi:methyl-accepting chemotaxis protein